MLLQHHESLEDALVRILAEGGPLTVKELHDLLVDDSQMVTLQAVYKKLKKLEDGQVVTKLKSKYSVNLAWVFSLQQFTERVYSRKLKDVLTMPYLPGREGKKVWTFPDLWSVYELWMHLIFSLCIHGKGDLVCAWVPYPWFAIIHRTRKPLIRQALRYSGKHFVGILARDCFVSQLCIADWPSEIYHHSFDPSLWKTQGRFTIHSVDEYQLIVETTQAFADKMQDFFLNTKSGGITPEEVCRLFQKQTKVKVSLVRDSEQAHKFQSEVLSRYEMSAGAPAETFMKRTLGTEKFLSPLVAPV